MGKSKHDVEVTHRKHFSLSFCDPAVACGCLTLGAMAIAAGVIGDGLMSTLGALVAMAAEHGGAATPLCVQHLGLPPMQPTPAFFVGSGPADPNNREPH